MPEKKAVLYTTVGPLVVGNEEDWEADNNLEKLTDVFGGAVDVISLKPAMDDQVGFDAWVKDDALETGTASVYQLAFGKDFSTVAFLPQGKAIVVLAVTQDGETLPLTHEQALEVQTSLAVTLRKRGGQNAR